MSMLKATFFAKRAKYSSATNVKSNPNIVLRKHSIQHDNMSAARTTARVMAPSSESLTPGSGDPKQPKSPIDLLASAQTTLLRNYQAEVSRQADLIVKQRTTINKMRSKTTELQSILKLQHGRYKELDAEKMKAKVLLCKSAHSRYIVLIGGIGRNL